MSGSAEYVPASSPTPGGEGLPPPAGSSRGRMGGWLALIAGLLLLGFALLVAWRWIDRNLLHWGLSAGEEQTLDEARLLERVQAFELATVKHTYASEARVDAQQVLNAGPKKVNLPGWLAGQSLSVKGEVEVTAGVDLDRLRAEDMEVVREGKDTRVTIRLPAPTVLSSELKPGTLDMSTSAGVVTRFLKSVGVNEEDMRDRAADEVIVAGRDAAVERGILEEAGRESERRLERFLQELPQSGEGRVLYTVVSRQPATQ